MSTMEVRKPRQVARRFLARPQHEGAGAVVRRSIGRFELRYFDPFLVLDEFSASAPAGFPDHPHRGFETVTYMLEGAVTHEDFEGHRGTIKAGDVQWMTAGRGIVHSEMPAGPGTSKGLQLWGGAGVPGVPEQGHRVHGVGGRRRDGAGDRGAGHGRPVAGAHADTDHVPRLHGAAARRRARAAAGAGLVERVRVRAGGRGRVRGDGGPGGGGAPPAAARAGRRRRGGLEQVGQAAPVRARRRRAHRRARGAAGPLRDEHRGGDRRHRQRLRVLHQRVRKGQALEVAGHDRARARLGWKKEWQDKL
ncbi:uncharacterized protein LOC123395805 isoform X1 [Hordeum vulgare subsp. vulgare]|uniref:uncharacterized protein LOC123395805 isoform X1 n=1 Tax=Hordeum vulgare subsp. vulgare TaxID=112509 RepID=UPI001D1A5841|nr:uncharacterized protein LOC123395805 isoform X1 [Hordeum vulgare subsp. vulgare]